MKLLVWAMSFIIYVIIAFVAIGLTDEDIGTFEAVVIGLLSTILANQEQLAFILKEKSNVS